MPFDLPPPQPSLEIVIASRGYSKGVAQTDGPQILARPELSFGSFRLGAYAKNATSPDYDGEAGVLAGVRRNLGSVEIAGSAALKRLVNSARHDRNALELTVSATRSVGKLKPRVSLTYSPDELGSTRRSHYWEAGSSYQFDKDLTASGGIGIRARDGGPDYTSYNIGVTRSIAGPFAADIRFHGTSKRRLGDYYKQRIVVGLRARF